MPHGLSFSPEISIRSFLLSEAMFYVSANDINRRALIIDPLRPEYVVAFNFVMSRRSASSCPQAEFLYFPLLRTLIEKCSLFRSLLEILSISCLPVGPNITHLYMRLDSLEYSSKSVSASPRDDHWATSMAGTS